MIVKFACTMRNGGGGVCTRRTEYLSKRSSLLLSKSSVQKGGTIFLGDYITHPYYGLYIIHNPAKTDNARLVAWCLQAVRITLAMHGTGEDQCIPGWQYGPGLQFSVAKVLLRSSCTIKPFHMLTCLLSIQGPMVYRVYAHMIRMISSFSITPLQVDAI